MYVAPTFYVTRNDERTQNLTYRDIFNMFKMVGGFKKLPLLSYHKITFCKGNRIN